MIHTNIEIGCGKRKHSGWTSIDVEKYANPDILGDFRTMEFSGLEAIRSHHVFEHFGREEAEKILELWNSWLKPGGVLIIETPDFEGICANFAKDKYWMARHAYGSQEADWAYHKDGYWQEKFEILLPKFGFEIESISKSCSRKILPNITVVAKKYE